MKQKNKISLIFAFWGDWYEDKFLQHTLPSLLSKGNIEVLLQNYRATIRIGSLEKHISNIEASIEYRRLKKIFPCTIHAFDDELGNFRNERDSKYTLWAHMLNQLKSAAARENEDFLFLHGDSVYPPTFFKDLHDQISQGCDLVYTVGIRCDDIKYSENAKYVRIENLSRDGFDSLMLESQHRFIETQYFDSPVQSRWPCDVLFRLTDGSVYARYWTMHPTFVSKSIGRRDIEVNIDVDYDLEIVRKLIAQKRQNAIAVISGSSRYFVSLTDRNDSWLNHVIKSGDGYDELDYFTPENDTDRTDLICNWVEQYSPYKSVLAFKEEFHFKKSEDTPNDELAKIRAYCDDLLIHAFALDRSLVNEKILTS